MPVFRKRERKTFPNNTFLNTLLTPIFKKRERRTHPDDKFLNTSVFRDKKSLEEYLANPKKSEDLILMRKGKTIYAKRQNWLFEDYRLSTISARLDFEINYWLKGRYKNTDEPVIVLDWGCGDGKAITQLAKKNKDKAICYGYGMDSHKKWGKNKKYVKFIQNIHEVLPRYFRGTPLDLVYSHWGFAHLSDLEMKKHLFELLPKLKKGGVFITDFFESEKKQAEKENLKFLYEPHIVLRGKKFKIVHSITYGAHIMKIERIE